MITYFCRICQYFTNIFFTLEFFFFIIVLGPTQYVSISTPTLALESPFKNTNQPSPETTFPLYVPTDFLVDDYIYHTGRPTEIQFLQPSLSSTIESGKTMIPTLTGSNIQQTIKPTTSLSNKPAFSTFFSDFQKKLLRDHENEKKLTYEEKVKRRRDRQRDEIIAFVLSFSIVIIMMLTTGYICSKRNEIIKKRKKEKKLKKQMQLLEQQIKNRPKPLPPPKTAEYGYYGPNPDIIINNDDDVKQTMIDTNKENNHSYEQLDNISIITTDDDLNDIENGNMQSNKSKN